MRRTTFDGPALENMLITTFKSANYEKYLLVTKVLLEVKSHPFADISQKMALASLIKKLVLKMFFKAGPSNAVRLLHACKG